MSADGLERLQRAPAVPAAEESGADHPDELEESPADTTLGRVPHTVLLEEPQTETPLPAAAPRRRHATGCLQGAARAPQVSQHLHQCLGQVLLVKEIALP